MNAAVLPIALVLAFAVMSLPRVHAQSNVEPLLARVGERVVDFYKRAKNVVWIETSRVQAVDSSQSPVGFTRIVESELRLEADADPRLGDAAIVRNVRKVNGRAPRDEDRKDRAGCTDPEPLFSEPLAFLLPSHRSTYEFKNAGMGKDRDRLTVIIDFASVNRTSDAALIEAASGHDDCFDWSGHLASRGRIWVDAANYDVVRLERRLPGPVDVKVPALLQRRHHLDTWVVIVRDDVTIRYGTVAFSDPEEVLLLPESIDMVTLVRGGLQSTRRNHTFSDYRRFVTGGRVVEQR